jgi:hypothetical protein
MRHRLRWIVLVVVVLVVGGAVALVLLEKPTLDDDRDAVDARWQQLRGPLAARYDRLDAVLAAFVAAGGGDRSVAQDLEQELTAWQKAVKAGAEAAQAATANRLEGQGTRVRANVFGSPRFASATELTDRIGEFAASAPSSSLVRAYNRAVRAYENDRTETLRTPVARLFGFDARPVLVITG